MIHMLLQSDKLKFVVGNAQVANNMPSVTPMQPFSDEIVTFLDALSKKILKNSQGMSDAATFGFWCRKAAIVKEKNKYDDIALRLGKGIVFHSTPSNVAVNFAFSFAAGLLAGNANIVRLPAKDFEQVNIICTAVNELLDQEFSELAPYICMVKYPTDTDITGFFSSICDMRMVWGGDGTISEIRKSPIKARASEINFADRHSIAAINADEYLKSPDKEKLAVAFYNDTYFSDQNACTAPRVIFWLGQNKTAAKKEFWSYVATYAAKNYNLTPVQAVGKLNAFYKAAAFNDVSITNFVDNMVTRINVNHLSESLIDYKYNSGFYFEYDIEELSEILPVCGERCQTLTYFGISRAQLADFFVKIRPKGVDRAVPMGKSMDFSLIWDGNDLIRALSRRIEIV